eukprot:SAG11_NODE_1606_length_4591_cov_1.769813_3_plen_100_part_00
MEPVVRLRRPPTPARSFAARVLSEKASSDSTARFAAVGTAVLLLLRNGPGLRGLTVAYTFFAASQSTWSIQSMFRLGPLRWSRCTEESHTAAHLCVALL